MYGVLGIKRANIMFNSFRGLSFICLCDKPRVSPWAYMLNPVGVRWILFTDPNGVPHLSPGYYPGNKSTHPQKTRTPKGCNIISSGPTWGTNQPTKNNTRHPNGMLNSFRVLLFFWVMRYSQGFTLGLHVEPLWGSLDAFIFFDYVYGPQRGPTSEPRVLPGDNPGRSHPIISSLY
jgi:hypothetical protein